MGNSADRTGKKRNTAQKDLGNKDLENRSKTNEGQEPQCGKNMSSNNRRKRK